MLISRWDGREEQKEANTWLKRIKEQLGPCLVDWYPQNRDPLEPFTMLRIPHVAYFSFGEKLPVLTHNTRDPELPGYYYAKLADVLDALGNPDFNIDELFKPKSKSTSIRRIFISAVSREMRTYRHVVAESLTKLGIEVVFEELFIASAGNIVEQLRDSISSADAMIILLGKSFGASPSSMPGKSYQQCEYETAVQLKKPIFCFVRSEDSAADTHDYQEKDLQAAFIQQVLEEQVYSYFRNAHELQLLVAQLDLRPEFKPQNLPVVGSLFLGREEILDQLRSSLVKKPSHIAAVTSIHGLGGVGKTRIAIEYAERYAYEYSALLFIPADSVENLRANLANLCGSMVLDLPEKDARVQDDQIAAAIRWLRAHTGWLLIVDSIDTLEAAAAVEEMLQKIGTGHVVITSRLSKWGHHTQELALDVLSESAAVEFLIARTAEKQKSSSADLAEAKALAYDLGHLPLALEQASAFILSERCSFAEYRRLLSAKDDEVISWHDSRMTKYPRSLATTWQTSFDRLGNDGRNLLKVLCWLAPDPIPLAILEKLDGIEFGTKINWKKARRELAEYSFVKWADGSSTSIHIHRLVLEITQFRMPGTEKLSWLKVALNMVDHFCVGDPEDVRSWKDVFTPARPHLEKIVHAADQARIAEPTARLMSVLAAYLKTRAEYAEAEPLLRRALAINEATSGSDDANTAIQLRNLASLLQETNRMAEAEPLIRRALSIDEQFFGPDHPYVAGDLNNLAALLQATNRLAEAEPLMRRAIAIDEASFGPEHPNVATVLNNLAQLLQATNRLAEAEPLLRRSLAIEQRSFGTDHPNVARDLNNLAQLLQATNRLAEAEPLMRRAIAIDEATFGIDHPSVAIRLNNLAQLLQATNRLAKAEPLMGRVISIFEASLGNEHPNVATALNNLALLLRETGRISEAEPLFRRALVIFESSYGADHPYVARSLANLAESLASSGKSAEAIPLLEKAANIYTSTYGENHPNMTVIWNNQAQIYQALGKIDSTEKLYEQILRILLLFQKQTGHIHPSFNSTLKSYSKVLEALGHSEEQVAEKLRFEPTE